MPRKYNKRKRKTNYVRNAKSAMEIASKALTIALALKKLMNVEKKFKEIAASQTPGTGGAVTYLTAIGQGDTQNERQGNSLKAYANNLSYTINMSSMASDTLVRVMLVKDQVSDGTPPTINDILETTFSGAGQAHYNPNYAGSRFSILYDRKHALSINGSRIQNGKSNLKLSHHVKYKGTTSGQLDAQSGHLYLITWSNETVNWPTLVVSNVFRYVDN